MFKLTCFMILSLFGQYFRKSSGGPYCAFWRYFSGRILIPCYGEILEKNINTLSI